jgi:hypothetical protein
MENGALPRGASYRVHPRLYLLVVSVRCQSSEAIGGEANTPQESLKLARMARTHPQTSGCTRDQHNGRHLTHRTLVGLGGRSQIIDCHHGERPYTDDESLFIDEEVRAMIGRGRG